MIFCLYRNRITNDTNIKINGQMVARVSCTKFLGVLIDEKLSWANNIKFMKIIIFKSTGILNKAKKTYKLVDISNLVLQLYLSLPNVLLRSVGRSWWCIFIVIV